MDKLMKRLMLGAAAALLSLGALAQPASYGNAGNEAPSNSFVALANGPLTAFYTDWAGSLTVLVGARINGVDGPVGLNNQSSGYGDSFVLGNVSAGDSLVFFVDVTNTGDNTTARYYSDKTLNLDGRNHAWTLAYAGDALVPAGLHIAFEDLPGGSADFNYHDHGIVVQGVLAIPAPVPEPASWALLLGGAGLLALRRPRG
ncbi:MAG: PEP-CTERM sorting domain-containing protein [Rubrivivax sp.]|nr:MAG: PEP-CTERM sorting domain-containing protein [Rubrivivax sp.]